MQSLMSGIFDVHGTLQWVAAGEFSEPRLCFSMEANLPLDEVLLQPAAGQPLDILLGPMPEASPEARDRWLTERQRIWDYVALEAKVPETKEGGTSPAASSRMAR